MQYRDRFLWRQLETRELLSYIVMSTFRTVRVLVRVLVREQPYCAGADPFQPCQSQGSAPHLSMLRRAHTSQTNRLCESKVLGRSIA